MAVRPYWRGYLKLSLVTCAVTLAPATSDGERVRFHTLNRKTNDRIRTRYVDAVSGKMVDDDDQARGYPKGEGDYVILEEEDLEAVQLESTRTIDIGEFVEADTIEWVYFDSPYFILPADDVGEEAYVVIREAMAQNNVVGISRLVLGNRERAVMLQPWGKGIILWTLRFGDEVRDDDDYFDKVSKDKTDGKLQSMVEKLIEQRTTSWSESMVKAEVQEKLLKLIKSKDKKKTAPKRKQEPEDEASPATNVIDLMAALKKSLEGKPSGKGKSR